MRTTPEVVGSFDPMACRKPSSKQPTITKAFGGKLGKARDAIVCLVGKFCFDTNIAPHKVTSSYLKTMLDATTEHGPGLTPPPPYKIDVYYVEEYEEVRAWVDT